MPEKVKEKNITEEDLPENGDKSDENEESGYYYDDACGYEIYIPDDEMEDNS